MASNRNLRANVCLGIGLNNQNNEKGTILRWREKTIRTTMSAGCAEMRKTHKIGCSIHFGETGESPDTFNYYCQHNRILRRSLTIFSHQCQRIIFIFSSTQNAVHFVALTIRIRFDTFGSDRIERPSSGVWGNGIPARSQNVGNMSIVIVGTSLFVPGTIRPGTQTSSGSRMPPL